MRAIFLILLSCLVAGCSVSTVITPQSSRADYDRINSASGQRTAEVQTTLGTVHHGHSVRLATDSVRWKLIEPDMIQDLRAAGIHPWPEHQQAIPLSLVREVRIKNATRGMRDGLLFGIASGFVLVTAIETGRLNGPPWNGVTHEATDLYVSEMLVGGIVGGLVGIVIGANAGSTTFVHVQQAADSAAGRNTN